MPEDKIHVIGYDEIVLMLGLLGIDGTPIEEEGNFRKVFDDLSSNPSIGMILIAMDLDDELREFLFEFKINHRKPVIFIIPDIFREDPEDPGVLMSNIYKSIDKFLT